MKLVFEEIGNNTQLLPEEVCAFIRRFDKEKQIRAAQIDPRFADGASLSAQYDLPLEMELNCLIVEGKRNEETIYVAILVPYGKKVNLNSKVRNLLGVRKVSFADLNKVCALTGMEYGSITPIGLPEDFRILADRSILSQPEVIVGGGKVCSKLILPSQLFSKMDNCIIEEGLIRE